MVKQRGLQVKTTKLHAIAAQLVNQAVRGHYLSIRALFKFAQFDRLLNEPKRERRGLSEEGKDVIMRALCGDDYASQTTAPSDHSDPIAPAPGHADASAKSIPHQREEPYAIGYRRPPVHARFQKGRSGNPAGRPRVSKGFRTSVHKLLEEQVTVTENGCAKRYTKLELIFIQIVNEAASGDLRFQNLLLEHASALDIELHRRRALPKNIVERLRKRLLDGFLGPETPAPAPIQEALDVEPRHSESVSQNSSPAEIARELVPVPASQAALPAPITHRPNQETFDSNTDPILANGARSKTKGK